MKDYGFTVKLRAQMWVVWRHGKLLTSLLENPDRQEFIHLFKIVTKDFPDEEPGELMVAMFPGFTELIDDVILDRLASRIMG